MDAQGDLATPYIPRNCPILVQEQFSEKSSTLTAARLLQCTMIRPVAGWLHQEHLVCMATLMFRSLQNDIF